MSASYPSAVKSFANRSPGQTIASAHVNDLQDEVAAIESALVNGPLTLPASTVATLSVAGGSTFVGAVTLAGSLTRLHSCRVQYSTIVAVPTATFTSPAWDLIAVDPSGMHSTSANSSRITFTPGAGLYMVGTHIPFSPNSSGTRTMRIVLNDVTPIGGVQVSAAPAGNQTVLSHSVLALVTSSSDYVTVQVQQDSGSTSSLSTAATYGNSFWAYRVSV